MRLTDMLGRELLFFDGAMGTQLQAAGLPAGTPPDMANLTMPETVAAIHRAYLDAGANLLKANTFGANPLKLAELGHSTDEIVRAGVQIAREAIAGVSGPRFVAMDIGPSGRLLAPLGDLDFEDAVAAFSAAAQAGAKAGADCILIETMSDTHELKAAVLAAKETGLPVLATVTVDARGKLLTGADMAAVAVLLEGLRVDAIGLNCGFGSSVLLPLVATLREYCGLPLILNPNAGMPHSHGGETVYDETPEVFAAAAREAIEAGACVLGGCCGTTPAHIAAMVKAVRDMEIKPLPRPTLTAVSSGARAVVLTGGAPVLIGERINPTGKPAMKRALQSGSDDYMLREAVRQQEAGVQILDVNVGLPGIDEAATLARLVPAIQGISDLPLQIDTANPAALAGAMRRYNGKPMINSVNGKAESMAAVFPLVRQYGGVVVALTLDETGIPKTAQGRVDIARRIAEAAEGYGIDRRDIVVDPLTMAVSAEPDAALVALEALRRIRSELGMHTVLGVSNISFGLPSRAALNATFFTLAAGAGLSSAIVNPYAAETMRAWHALRALYAEDEGCTAYIGAMAQADEAAQATPAPTGTLSDAIRHGLREEARALAAALAEREAPLAIIEGQLIPALNAVGEDFERGRAFLPQLLMSAEAAKAAFEALGAHLSPGERGGRGTVVIATVQGDIHDIGKNIARAMLENYQFDVIDLGRDVPPEKVVETVRAHGARLVGLSALMTTTVESMAQTIALLRRDAPECRVMVGGAVLTPDYATSIGADRHVRDAMDSVRYAQKILGDQ